MGAKQSKRSVDITTTPKKGEAEAIVEGEGKVEKIGDVDVKATTNGALHTELEYADKDEETVKDEKGKDEVKENGVPESTEEELKKPDAESPPVEASKTETAPIAKDEDINEKEKSSEKTPEKPVENGTEKAEETPENKKNKEKTKKKKWSFRSISFSKKDKSKPAKDAEKNGEVKEVVEENAEENATTSPSAESAKTDESKSVESPTANTPMTNGDATAAELSKSKEEEKKDDEASKVEDTTKVTEVAPIAAPTPPAEQIKVEETKPSVENPVVVEEKKEVRSEELPPPPLPSSNPPSPVTVFAESTKADALPADQVPPQIPEDTSDIPLAASSPKAETENVEAIECVAEEELVIPPAEPQVPNSENTKASSPEPPQNAELPVEIVTESEVPSQVPSEVPISPEIPVDVQKNPELPVEPSKSPELPPAMSPELQEKSGVNPADSLPDISTESLPSMPEPLSESLPEPMSLPPVDSVPEPIACENGINEDTSLTNNLPTPTSENPIQNNHLTNGTNGLSSPVSDEAPVADEITTKEGALKQVPEIIPVGELDGSRQEDTEKTAEKVAENTAAVTTVEE